MSTDLAGLKLAGSALSASRVVSGRDRLFRERPMDRLRRVALAVAYVMQPKRIARAPALAAGIIASMARGGVAVPTSSDLKAAPGGFAGVVKDATPISLMAAHRAGFFPQAHMGPLKWWTRSRRYVLKLDERFVPKRIAGYMRKAKLQLTFDRAFDEVIAACAEPRPGRPRLTWITPNIKRLYAELHDLGHAHSFELWDEAGALVGGGYGVAVGQVFVTESLFSRVPNASKIGFQALNYHLERWGFVLNDVKDFAPHFDRMGLRHIPRADYEELLNEYGDTATRATWVVEATPAEVGAMPGRPPLAARPATA